MLGIGHCSHRSGSEQRNGTIPFLDTWFRKNTKARRLNEGHCEQETDSQGTFQSTKNSENSRDSDWVNEWTDIFLARLVYNSGKSECPENSVTSEHSCSGRIYPSLKSNSTWLILKLLNIIINTHHVFYLTDGVN